MSNTKINTQYPKQVLLVSDIDSPAAWRLASIIHGAGAELHVMAPSDSLIFSSRYVTRKFPFPETIQEAIDWITMVRKDYDAIQYAGEDLLTSLLDDPGKLHQFQDILQFPWQEGERILTKSNFLAAASECHLPVPKLEVYDSLDKAVQAALYQLPCVLKQNFTSAGEGVHITYTEEDVHSAIQRLSSDQSTMVQQFISGTTGTTDILFSKGKALFYNSWLAIETVRGDATSPAASRRSFDHSDIQELVEAVGEMTTFDGFCGIDWILDPDTNKLWFIEFNARATPGYGIIPSLAQEYSTCYRSMLEENPRPSASQNLKTDEVIKAFPEYYHYLTSNYDLANLIKYLTSKQSLSRIPIREPGIVFRLLGQGVHRLFRQTYKRIKKRFQVSVGVSPEATERTAKTVPAESF